MFIASSSLLVLVALVGQGASVTVNDCPSGLTRNEYLNVYQDWCFEFVYGRRNDYDDANDDCKINGGSLALVKTEDIQNFLYNLIRDYVLTYDEDYEPLWIGLNDKETEGVFVWEDGTNLTYSNWDSGEGPNHPSANTQDCAAIGTYRGLWVDEHCQSSWIDTILGQGGRPYICQYDAVSSTAETPVSEGSTAEV